jgi:Family of unknown function (DUF6152)
MSFTHKRSWASHVRRAASAVAGAVLVAAAPPTWAHHAFSAEFDVAQPVELKGVVTKLQWTNPHSWIYVDVKDADGTVTTWAVEFGSPYALMRKGLRKTDFPLGVEVAVNGFRARSGKTIANASSVALADGRGFYTAADDAPATAANAE